MKKILFILLAMTAMLSASAQDNKCVVKLKDGTLVRYSTKDVKEIYWEIDDGRVKEIVLDKTELSLDIDETYTFTATVLPATALNKELDWTSSNPDVVNVNRNGKVVAWDYGTATITCTAKDGSGVKAECVVTVKGNDEPSGDDVERKVFTVNGVTFNMIKVEAGTFQMGSTSGNSEEKPAHKVTISRDYYIGETEVTQALWKAVTDYSLTIDGSSWSSTYGIGDDYPAYSAKYNEVQNFISTLNSLTGETFRMPTEAEWEYAARGGNKSQGYTYSGSNTLDDVAWYDDNSGSKLHAVKTKAANELGIYDMSGNVWEWCSDWYDSSYYNSFTSKDPTGPSSGTDRVRRGGGWSNTSSNCRTATRSSGSPSLRYYSLGVRLALSSSQSGESSSEDKTPTISYSHAVDLGLPSGTKWADMNVGAEKPEDYGWYLAWGETKEKDVYKQSTFFVFEFEKYDYRYSYDKKIPVLDPEDDAATVNWGGKWRMPTNKELEELQYKCTWSRVYQNGVYGAKVTGPNGNSIFLPAAGYREEKSRKDAGSRANYWSNTYSLNSTAYYLNFILGVNGTFLNYSPGCYFGYSVRPVCPKK